MAQRSRPLASALLVVLAALALGADHRDAPLISYDATADLNDVYAFVNPNDTDEVILALTVNPFSAPGNAHTFAPDVLYQFKIDNTGDFKEDLLLQATFTAAAPGTPQQLTLRGPARKKSGKSNEDRILSGSGVPVLRGPAGGILSDPATGVRVFAGLRDDPFFFDLTAVAPFLGLNANPTPARSPLGGGSQPRDFFAGMNVSVLVVEVPSHWLRGPTRDIVRIWGTTAREKIEEDSRHKSKSKRMDLKPVGGKFVQMDRMALAAYNTVFIPNGARGGYDLKPGTNLPNPPSRQDAFNKAVPARDLQDFFPDVLATVRVLDTVGNLNRFGIVLSADPVDTVLARLQYDVITLDLGSVGSGFEVLNGRRLKDDVVDVLLQLGSGIDGGDGFAGAGAADGVNGNDVAAGVSDPVSGQVTDATGFLPDFPFVAPPKPPSLTIPPRGGN